MKKLSLLFALLCASMMGRAADYCNAAITSVQGHDAIVTMRLVSGTTYEFSITTADDIVSYNAAGSNFYANKDGVGGYHVSEHLTQNGNTLSVQFTSTSAPSIYANDLYIVLDGIGENQFKIPMDASWAECGGSTPDPGEKFVAADASIHHSYFANWEWAQEYNSTASYNDATGEITVHIDNDKNIQWYAQVHFALGFAYTAGKYYDFSIKFHADKAVNQVTLKTNDDNALFYENQSVNIPEDDDYVWTKSDVEGVAGNNIFVFDFGHASANTNITISEISIIEKDAPSTPPAPVDPNDITAGGHTIHLDASYVGDIYTLVITSTDDMEGLGGSFWYVNGVSTDMRSNTYTVSGDKKTITCEVQSTSAPSIHTPLYVLMPGEINFGSVTLNWENRDPINSEYCNYQGSETHQDDHYYAITWETDPSGNVVITIGDGTGAGACSFRNGGFEGGNNGLDNFVISDDNFVTTTPATDYFTVTRPTDGDLEYVMTKIADLPANAKIKHLSAGAIAWREAGADRWCFPEFIYTYGGTCNQLDAPTNVVVDANNIITFDVVTGADSYTAYVSLSGVEKYHQAVASGDELTFVPLVDGAYDVTVVASGAGKVDSDPSTAFVWNLTATPIVLGNSEYCEHVMQVGTDTEVAFTWETDGSGNIVITISETLGGAADASHFRGNALALGNFTVGTAHAAGSGYFSHPGTTTGNQLVLTATSAPTPGEKIYYHGVVEYATSGNGNAWPTLDFEWTYGTVCSGKAVSATPNNNTMGTAVVQKAGVDVTNVDDGDEVTFIATVADAEQYRFINWTKGGVEVSTNATYVTTITETTNLIANFDYIRNTYCQYTVTSNASAVTGKKLYITLGSIGGGQYQIKFEGSAEAPLTALNNANYTINWVTTDIDNGQNMSGQDVPFPNARWSFDPTGYGSATAVFGIADGHTWEDIYVWNHSIFFATAGGELGYSGFPDRYHIAWTETCVDAEKPVMTSASLASTTSSSAIINVAATDDHVVDAYHVVDGTNSIDLTIPAAVQITVPGLVGGTTYNFVITALDACGKESENNVPVEVAMAATVTAPTTAPTAPTWPAAQVISFYSDAYTAPNTWNFRAPWGGSTAYEQVEIASNNVIHYSALDYVGWIYEAGGSPYNAINMEKLHLDIWVADDCTIGIVPIYGGEGLTTDDNKRVKPALTGQQWNSIDLDLAVDYAGLDLSSIFQFKFDQATTTEFWVDNVYFYRTTELVDNEAPTNVTASVAETGFYSVKITAQAEDNMGSVNFSVMNGAVEVATGAAVSGVATTITVNGLTPGTNYSFDVIAKDDKPNAAAPVAVVATTKVLPASAPTPDLTAKQYVPVYSDAIAGSKTGIQSGGWGESTIPQWLALTPNDQVFYAQNFNWAGWHSWGASIDATGMQYLHVDIYSTGMTQVSVTPISPGHEGVANITLTPNAWTSYDVDLSAYDANNIDWSDIFQFKFMNPVGGNELMVDNVYFWKGPDFKRDDSTGDDWMAPGELGTICIPNGAVAVGGDLYELVGKNDIGKIVFATVPGNVMVPGKPYLFQATSNAMNFFYTDATPAGSPDNSGAMKGTFDDLVLTELDNVYYFAGHALWDCSDLTSLEVAANRAYVKMDEVDEINTSNPAPGRRYITMDVQGKNTTTGMDELNASETPVKMIIDGQLFILRGEKLYNANGQLVK